MCRHISLAREQNQVWYKIARRGKVRFQPDDVNAKWFLFYCWTMQMQVCLRFTAFENLKSKTESKTVAQSQNDAGRLSLAVKTQREVSCLLGIESFSEASVLLYVSEEVSCSLC